MNSAPTHPCASGLLFSLFILPSPCVRSQLQAEQLRKEFNIDIRVLGIADSKGEPSSRRSQPLIQLHTVTLNRAKVWA